MHLLIGLLNFRYIPVLLLCIVLGHQVLQSPDNYNMGAWLCFAFIALAVQNNKIATPRQVPVWFSTLFAYTAFLSFMFPVAFIIYAVIGVCFFILASQKTAAELAWIEKENKRIEARDEKYRREREARMAEVAANEAKGNYGFGVAPLPPGGYKLLVVNAKLKDGSFAQFQSIGLEHQVRAMANNDPRFEWADVAVQSPRDWGRFPTY